MNEAQFIIAVTVPSVVAFVGAVGVFVAILVNHARINDLSRNVDIRIDDLKRYIDLSTKMILDKIDSIDHRLTDLEDIVRRGR